MNRRGKRLTLGVMAVGLAVVLVLAFAYRKPILEHIEAWHFQLTRETEVIVPEPGLRRPAVVKGLPGEEGRLNQFRMGDVVGLLVNFSGYPMILDHEDRSVLDFRFSRPTPETTPDVSLRALRAYGWRILEQRVPRPAYVLVGHPPDVGIRIFQHRVSAARRSAQKPAE